MGLAAFAVPLAVVWAALGIWLGRQQRQGTAQPQGTETVVV